MSDNLLVRTSDGAIRYGAASRLGVDVKKTAADTRSGRTIQDVVDISSGLKQADAIRSGTQSGTVADAVKQGSSAIDKAMTGFRALFGRAADAVGRFSQAVNDVVTEILSGPHPATQDKSARKSFWQRVTDKLGATNKTG